MNILQRILNLAGLLRPAVTRIFMSNRQAGMLVNEDTALTLGEWWACVSLISRTVAALPWHVFVKSVLGREQVDNAIAYLLNTRPNPEMSAFSFREALIAHALNWGNAYAEIQRDLSGRVVALWLITPDRVCVERRITDGAIVYRVTNEGAESTVLTGDQVFHLHGLGFDGLVGYSLVRMAARSIGIGLAQDTFTQSFYANGTMLGAIVEMPVTSMSPEKIADAEAYYNDKHGGPDKAFKVKVGPTGTKISSMGMPLNDAQFVESRQLTVTMAARWLGVPPHKIADLARSTNNNIEHQGIEWVTDGVVPWITRLQQEADYKLIGPRAQGRMYTRFNVNALMRGDSKARGEYFKTMVQMGAMSINEVRAFEEMNGIGETGDAHLVQLNQTTLDWLVANPGAKANQVAPVDQPADPNAANDDPTPDPAAQATNVIRREALEWYRAQRKQA